MRRGPSLPRALAVTSRLTAAACLFLLAGAGPASAQSAAGANTARGLISSLVVNRLTAQQLTPAELQAIRARAQLLADELTKGIAIAIATAPVGGSAAGFSYQLDPTTGEPVLRSASFAPLLMERPLTSGRGTVGFGVSYQRYAFDNFQGINLRSEGILLFDNRVRYTRDNFEQYIEEYLRMEPTVDTVTTVFSFGVTDNVDIGVIIPVSRIELRARRDWDYDISKTFAALPGDRAFFTPGPAADGFTQDSGSISASGVGDIALRTKIGFGPQRGEGAGVLFDLRLPTGDKENLLGTGEASGRLVFLASKSLGGRGNLYGSGGYTFGGLSDEINYAFGVDTQLLGRKQMTLSFEVVGQNLRDSVGGTTSNRFGPIQQLDTRLVPAEPTVYSAAEPVFEAGSNNVLRGAVGVKYLLGAQWLLTGGVVLPLNDEGLHGGVSPYIGLDFSWTRGR